MIARLQGVTVARSGKPLLRDISLEISPGDRIFLGGENGAGKSSLMQLLAMRLHPYNNTGSREYVWDQTTGSFRENRRHLILISREEQHRLQRLHAGATVHDFLLGHADGQDFLYRDITPADAALVTAKLSDWNLNALSGRRLKTLSLGEMRLVLIARADLHERKLYLLDEIFSSLSSENAERVALWINNLPVAAAVLLTGHDDERLAKLRFNRFLEIAEGVVSEKKMAAFHKKGITVPIGKGQGNAGNPPDAEPLISCEHADFYHDFVRIFERLSFALNQGERILITGPNGSGKTTLLRIMHGDFYPAWGTGSLDFRHTLAHEQKSTLWRNVQFIAAAHFTYYPASMTVQNVLASRISGSIYDFPDTIPIGTQSTVAAFELQTYLNRQFILLSEGEKTRVLLARAFLLPAPVYLIDEGFIALSLRYFQAAAAYLNALPETACVVIAANERIPELEAELGYRLRRWQLDAGRLTMLP